MSPASRSLLIFEIRTPHGQVILKVPPNVSTARFEPELSPYKAKLSPVNGRVRAMVATGQEDFQATAMRLTPPAKTVCATASVAQKKGWFTVSTAPGMISALQTAPDKVDSLWLVAVLAFRDLAMSRRKPFLVWLMGEVSSFVVGIAPDGAFETARRDSGTNDLIDAVETGLGLHFRSSAQKILFDEDFDWADAATDIAGPFTAGLGHDLRTIAPDTTLAVIGIGHRARGLEHAFAASLGIQPWTGPTAAEMTRLGWSQSPRAPGTESAECWALACLAGPQSKLFAQRLHYGGVPFTMHYEPAGAGGLIGVNSDPLAPTVDPVGTASPPSKAPPKSVRRSRGRGHFLRPQRNMFEWTRRGVLKWIAILIYIAAVAVGGHHYLARQAASHATMVK